MTSHSASQVVVLQHAGALDALSAPKFRDEAFRHIGTRGCTGLALDARNITRIDGIGLGMLAELRSFSLQHFHQQLEIIGASADLQRSLSLVALDDMAVAQLSPPRVESFIVRCGASVEAVFKDVTDLIRFMGEVLAASVVVARHPGHFRWREFLDIAQEVGANALPILSFLALLLGAILAFQTSVPLDRFGALSMVPTIVGLGIFRELGPLIAAILVAGRSGAAFAAELGTMRVSEELSVLRVLGLSPASFLVVPRILATILVLPLLTVYTDIVGIFGGFLVMRSLGYSLHQYGTSIASNVHLSDAMGGLFKTFVFAFLISFAGCERGISTGAGPAGVGRAATRAVVSAIVLVLFADVIFGFVYYVLRL